MRYSELLTEDVERIDLDIIIKAMMPIRDKKVIWRGMDGRHSATKVINDRSGFYGGIDGQADQIIKKLNIKNPAFGTFSHDKASFFGTLSVMVPLQPYKAMQSAKLVDLMHDSDINPDELVDSYSERMDLTNSEIIFDIKEYYLVDINTALYYKLDPDQMMGQSRLYPHINKLIDNIVTYQDVIKSLTGDNK